MNTKVTYPFAPEVKKFINTLIEKEIDLLLIGGASRDWLYSKKETRDLDFEIRSKAVDKSLNPKEITSIIKEAARLFKAEVEPLSFSILRIKLGCYELEFSFPREDLYSDDLEYGHSDFEAKIDLTFDYSHSFKRRDFSINAIGINVESAEIVDPWKGLIHLRDKKLVFINENDYFKDPVRFLRMLRFSIQFDLKLPDEEIIKAFNLKKLTSFYFKKEAFKVNFFKFCAEFFEITSRLNVELPKKLSALSYLAEIETETKVSSPLDVLTLLIEKEEVNPKEFVSYFEISGKKWKQILKEKNS